MINDRDKKINNIMNVSIRLLFLFCWRIQT